MESTADVDVQVKCVSTAEKQQMLAIACEQRDILFSLLYVEACCETKRW